MCLLCLHGAKQVTHLLRAFPGEMGGQKKREKVRLLTFKTMKHTDKHAVNSESLVEEREEGLYIGGEGS